MNNSTITRLLTVCFLTGIASLQAFCQEEMLAPLYSNQVIKSYLIKSNAAGHAQRIPSVTTDTLDLPVYDDFSAPDIFPDQRIWVDSNVFINPFFSTNPPTVGMATFDGLDKLGNPYDNSVATLYGVTDKLESKPINLFLDPSGNLYVPGDSITLSFYYQRRGLGDVPEYGDSLQLEFWNSITQKWDWQWSMDGGTFDFSFIRKFIKIADPQYLQKDFRFRFRSYGSLTGSLDNWNLDYVILRKPFFSNDILVNDIGYQLPARSLINTYTSIPYSHYKFIGPTGQANLMKSQDNQVTFNLFNTASAPSQVNFRIWDQFGSLQYQYNTSGNGNIVIPAASTLSYNYPNPSLAYTFPDSIPGNYAEFKLVDNLGSPNQDFNKQNDTIQYQQIFSNYYSYDDGSAEAAYLLNNAPGGKLAYRFNLLKADTLRGLYIHWNQMNANVSQKLFKMVVWSSLSPETILFQELNQKPMYYDSINGFRYYKFNQLIVLPAGPVFIGLVQSAADAINLGFDRNTDSNAKMYFNVTGTWINSQIPGSFMFRPVFGDSVLTTGIESPDDRAAEISVYPNPATDIVYVKTNLSTTGHLQFDLTDVAGRILIKNRQFEETIHTNHLGEGFYFLSFYDDENHFRKIVKLLIARD